MSKDIEDGNCSIDSKVCMPVIIHLICVWELYKCHYWSCSLAFIDIFEAFSWNKICWLY